MRINFSSKTKGSGKITPFYTIKAAKSQVCKMTKMLIKKWAKHWRPFYISAAWFWLRLFSLFCIIYLLLPPLRGVLQAADIHLSMELIAECVSFLVMIWGNPHCSPLLELAAAVGVMLDCLGHIFPFISPGTEMDVGQALQPGEAPMCAAQNTCPAVSRHPQSLPGQGGAPSLYISLSPTQSLLGAQRSRLRRNPGTQGDDWEIRRPKLHFLTRNQITTCWRTEKNSYKYFSMDTVSKTPPTVRRREKTSWYTNKCVYSVSTTLA